MTRSNLRAACLPLMGAALLAGEVQAAPPGPGWLTGQQVQNLGSATATVELTVHGPGGGAYSCGSRKVAPGAATTYLTERDCPVPPGFRGAGVVTADQPIATIVNVNNKPAGTAAGQYRATGHAVARSRLFFPLVKHNHVGRSTTCYIQNAGDVATDLKATFHMRSGKTFSTSYPSVAPNASVAVHPADAGVPAGMGQVGSLVVNAAVPLAGAALEHEHAAQSGSNLQATRAFSAADFDHTVFCPLLRHAHAAGQQSTGLQVQNVSQQTQTVKVRYSNGQQQSASIGPNASHTFYSPDILPVGAKVSARITGQGDLLAVVNEKGQATSDPTRVTSYSCFPSGSATTRVTLPLVKEMRFNITTGIQVQNVGAAPTKVTATYSSAKGTVRVRTAQVIAPGASFTFYRVHRGAKAGIDVLSGDPARLLGTNNGVRLEADQPIVAIANESSVGGDNVQDTKNYEGFNF